MGLRGEKVKENLLWKFDYRAWERKLVKDYINLFVRNNPFVYQYNMYNMFPSTYMCM
jgi:hypothetical protein